MMRESREAEGYRPVWNKRKAADPDDQYTAHIEERLERMENLLQRLTEQKPETHIHIERLHIQEAVLESMAVRLDSLDVKEVSGSLNIGNNFHTLKGEPGKIPNAAEAGRHSMSSKEKPLQKEPPSRETAGKSEKDGRTSFRRSSAGMEPGVYRTASGYSFRFDKRNGGG